MKMTMDNVEVGASGTWTATINPQKIINLYSPLRQGGKLTIILVAKPIYYDETQELQFAADSVELLNIRGQGA